MRTFRRRCSNWLSVTRPLPGSSRKPPPEMTLGAAAQAPTGLIGGGSRGTVRRVTGRCVTELRHPHGLRCRPRVVVGSSSAVGRGPTPGVVVPSRALLGGCVRPHAVARRAMLPASRCSACCVFARGQPAPRTRQPALCPANPPGALAIRSGDQDGLNVIVVIDQQRLDRSDRPMQAGSEILRQRLPMREGLPLEGDGPAPGGEGTLDIAIVPGEQRDQRRSRLSHERRQMVGQRGAARELLALIHDRNTRAKSPRLRIVPRRHHEVGPVGAALRAAWCAVWAGRRHRWAWGVVAGSCFAGKGSPPPTVRGDGDQVACLHSTASLGGARPAAERCYLKHRVGASFGLLRL